MIPHKFVCPECGEEILAKSKAYALNKGARHLFKKHPSDICAYTGVYLTQFIKEVGYRE